MTDATPPPPPPSISPVPSPAASQPPRWRLFLILGGLALFLVVVLYAVRNNQAADELAVGQCFDVPSSGTDITTVTRHACTEAHDAEVFHVVESGEATYPVTSLRRNAFVEGACFPAFDVYVGTDIDSAEDLDIGYFYPTASGWERGDRTFTCYAVRTDGAQLTESVRGSGA